MKFYESDRYLDFEILSKDDLNEMIRILFTIGFNKVIRVHPPGKMPKEYYRELRVDDVVNGDH